MKLFRTSDINVVTECQLNFHFQLTSGAAGKTSRKICQCLWSDFIVACKLSDCQYLQIANFGYCVVIIYCAVAIVYCIISLFDSVLPLW